MPAAMIFVRNPTGVSHAPQEYAEPADCEAGAAVLASALGELLSRAVVMSPGRSCSPRSAHEPTAVCHRADT